MGRMKQRVLMALLTVTLTASGVAQLKSVRQGRPFLANGDLLHPVWSESVENSGTSSIVALHSNFRCFRPGHSELDSFRDPLVNFGSDREVDVGKSVEINAANPQSYSGGVDAVLFSDGHGEGDRQQLKNIYARRKGVSEELRSIKKLLDEGAAGRMKTAQILQKLQVPVRITPYVYVDSLGIAEPTKAHDPSEIEDEGRSEARSTVAIILRMQSIWGVPSEHMAERKPRVEQVMRERGVPRDQAYLMITSMKVQEWEDALTGNLKPPKFRRSVKDIFN
jgi:hypothetical protein